MSEKIREFITSKTIYTICRVDMGGSRPEIRAVDIVTESGHMARMIWRF